MAAGSLGLLSLAASAAPAFEAVHYLKEAAELYARHIRDPLFEALGLTSRYAPFLLDIAVLWIGTFAAVNAFIYKVDGTFVWGHVGHNYCFRNRQTALAQFLCRAPKFMWAFLLTPLVCLMSIYAVARTGHSHLTMAFVTVNPKLVAKYLVALVAIPAVLIAVAALVLKALGSS